MRVRDFLNTLLLIRPLILEFIHLSDNGVITIDNVSVKEVRATTVEASKCLADAIHRIGIQDIQN